MAFCLKIATDFCAKIVPRSPLKGDQGRDFGVLTAQKIAAIIRAKRTAQRPPPSEPPQGDQKGEVNMTTPNTGELLVQQAQEAERLRLLILADECKTIEEFRQRLRDLVNK